MLYFTFTFEDVIVCPNGFILVVCSFTVYHHIRMFQNVNCLCRMSPFIVKLIFELCEEEKYSEGKDGLEGESLC